MSETPELRPGTISSIRAQRRSPERVSVFIDDGFAFGIHRDVLLEFDLKKGQQLNVEEQSAIVQRDAFFKARAKAFRFLSYRDRSAWEIRRRLDRDDFPSTVIDDVVHDLTESGYVNDYKFARAFAEDRFQAGGYGPLRVRADLRKKRVRRDAVDTALAEVFGERDELLERARELGTKRWQQLERETDAMKRRKKVYDYLARRGYRFEMARRVVDELEVD